MKLLKGLVLIFPFCFMSFAQDDPRDFDSPDQIALDASLSEGVLLSPNSDPAVIQLEIRSQLRYLVGYFFKEGSPALYSTLNTTLSSVKKRGDGFYDVTYKAEFLLSWMRPTNLNQLPKEITAVVPKRGDASGLEAFNKKYQSICYGKTPFWYYYSVSGARCGLSTNPPPEDAVRPRFSLKVSSLNSQGKYPEYEKLWEDGELKVLYVAGNMESESPGESLVVRLGRRFGEPLAFEKKEFTNYVVQNVVFKTSAGKLDVQTMDILVGNMQTVDEKFKKLYRDYLLDADLVAYNGHAGLGANIRSLTQLALFKPKHYYLYWLNACKPFHHLDNALHRAIETANPGTRASKYLDIMTVANIGTFSFANDVDHLIPFFVAKESTFRTILKGAAAGNPVVLGDEDNVWPKKFID